MPLLDAGDPFPQMTFDVVEGDSIIAPDAFAGSYAALLVYRGAWCPYCVGQLRSFSRSRQRLADAGVEVLALSVEDAPTGKDLIQANDLKIPIAHSVDAHAFAAGTGAFTSDVPLYLQSTGFLLDPTGNVIVASYSTGPVPRLMPDEVIGLVKYHASSD